MATSTYSYSGTLQIFTATNAGWYRIDAFGAQGGGSQTVYPVSTTLGGTGAEAEGDVYLFAGEQLQIVVGGRGADTTANSGGNPTNFSGAGGGGGGGTFVFGPGSSPLVVAGGGGGASLLTPGDPGQATTSGSNGTSLYSSPSLSGTGGTAGSGGTAPTNATYSNAGGGGGGISSGGTSGPGQSPTYGTPSYGKGGGAIVSGGNGGQGGISVDFAVGAGAAIFDSDLLGAPNPYQYVAYDLNNAALYRGGNGGYGGGGGGGGDYKAASELPPSNFLSDQTTRRVELIGSYATIYTGGGGGGGGYSGGGGGVEYEGGGGGGSFITASAQNVSLTAGVERGNGLVTISSSTPVAIEGETLSATIYSTQTIKPYAAARAWDDPSLNGTGQAAVEIVFDSGTGTFSNYGSATLLHSFIATPFDSILLLQGTGSQMTQFLRGLVFTPSASIAKPGQPGTATFAVKVIQGAEQTDFALSRITVVSAQTPPTIAGTAAHQVVTAGPNNTPLANVTITDTDPYETETVTITLTDGTGPTDARGSLQSLLSNYFPITKTGVGTYTVTGAPALVSATLDQLNFKPAAGNATPGQSVTTGITLSVTNAFGATATDTTTSVDYTYINPKTVITGSGASTLSATTATPTTGGMLSAFGAGAVSSSFQAPSQAALTGTYGTFTFNAGTGTWGYTLDENRASTQALLKGQQANDTLTVASLDGQASSNITVTVVGSNSAPIIGGGATTGQVAELLNTTGSTQSDTASGVFSFTDQDLADTHAATVGAPSFSWTGGSLTAAQQSALSAASLLVNAVDVPQTGAGTVAWSYRVPDAALDFLAVGETLSATYGVTLTDNHGAKASQSLVVTVAGANDAPALSGGVNTGAIAERPGLTGASTADTASGSFGFVDPDRTNLHTVLAGAASFAWSGGVLNATQLAALGAGQLTLGGSEETGTVTWSYSAPDQAFDFLAAGQTLTVSTPVTIADGYGGSVVQTVVVTITGSNDVASISGRATGAVGEDGTTAAAGILTVTDADSGQAGFAPPSAVALAGTYGTFTFNPAAGAWTYALNNAAANVQALAQGQIVTDTFAVRSLDGTSTQDVKIQITGVNDAPTLSGGVTTGAITERAGLTGASTADTASGSFTFVDVDRTDLHTAIAGAASFTWSGGTLNATQLAALGAGQLALGGSDETGTVTWSYSAPDRAFDFLAAGQTLTVSTPVRIADGYGGSVVQSVVVTITGSNDAAAISGSMAGAVGEDGTTTAAGTLIVTDADAGQASFATPAAAAQTGTYGTFTFNPAAGAWSYVLNNAATKVQALAQGQIVSDTLTVQSLDGTATQDLKVQIAGANDAPTITGTKSGQTTTDYAPLRPFATVSVGDIDNGAQDSLTITLSNPANGSLSGVGLSGGSGVYTLAATDPATLTKELQALSFAPTQGQVKAGSTVTTTFTLAASDGIAAPTKDAATSVTATALNYVKGHGPLTGTTGVDVITATGSGNVIFGLGGADIIDAGTGVAAVTLGNGNATVTLGGSLNAVVGGNGNVTVTGAPGGYTSVTLGDGNNVVNLSGLKDLILLGNGNNTVTAKGGMSFIATGSGNDTITLGGTGNVVNAGAGSNVIQGGAGSDTFVLPAAGGGFDTITGFSEFNADVLDLRAALAATKWNHQASTLGNYLKVTNSGGATNLAIVPTGSGAGTAIASLSGTSYGLADLVSHHALLTA